MSEAAVMEQPAAEAEAVKPENPEAIKPGLEAEHEGAPSQPADKSESETKDDTPAEDEGERLQREAHEAELEAVREQGRQDERQRIANAAVETAKETARKARDAEIATATSGFAPVIATIQDVLTAARVDEDVIAEALAPLNGHNGKIVKLAKGLYDNATKDVATAVSDWAVETAPEGEVRSAIQKMVDADEPLPKVLDALVDAKALSSPSVSKAKPEDLIASNAALKAKIAGDLAKEQNRVRKGIAEGSIKPWPDGEPDTSGAAAPGKYTYADITKMNKSQLDALPEGVFERVMGMTRS